MERQQTESGIHFVAIVLEITQTNSGEGVNIGYLARR
jgi:hypothetical protein